MNKNRLIKVNLINTGILALIIVFNRVLDMLFNDHEEGGSSTMVILFTLILLVGWIAFTIYSNMTIIRETDIEQKKEREVLRTRLMRADRRGRFPNEKKHLLDMWESIQSREKYFRDPERDDRIRELFELTQNQVMRNITNACEYMESFDYITGRDTGYLGGVCGETQELLDKFNKLAELSVSYDDSTLDYDTREIDDMIDALEYMKKTGKAKLGS